MCPAPLVYLGLMDSVGPPAKEEDGVWLLWVFLLQGPVLFQKRCHHYILCGCQFLLLCPPSTTPEKLHVASSLGVAMVMHTGQGAGKCWCSRKPESFCSLRASLLSILKKVRASPGSPGLWPSSCEGFQGREHCGSRWFKAMNGWGSSL